MSTNEGTEGDHDAHTAAAQTAAAQTAVLAAAAQDLGAIRTILLAAANSLSVELPATALSSIDVTPLLPNQTSYDAESVIQYKLDQLPTDEIFDSEAWRRFYSGPPKPNFKTSAPSARGLQTICTWTLKFVEGQLYRREEFGYDNNGYLRRRGNRDNGFNGRKITYRPDGTSVISHEFTETVFISTATAPPMPIPVDQSFATEWHFDFHQGIEAEKLSIIILQLCGATECTVNYTRAALAMGFLAQFRGYWMPSRSYLGDSGLTDLWVIGQDGRQDLRQDLVFQYHLRVFTAVDLDKSEAQRKVTLDRITGDLAGPNSRRKLRIKERRWSIGLRTTWRMDLPIFSLVTMAEEWTHLENAVSLDDANIWQNADIQPSNRATGIAAFAFRIRTICSSWQAQWTALLDRIDDMLEVDLQNILSHDRRVEIMYDSEALELSEFYFAILQILLIAGDWIQGSMDDLQHLVDSMEKSFFTVTYRQQISFLPDSPQARAMAVEVFKRNWGSVLSHQQRLGKGLLNRISKKQEEVKSLRDGLFNATSVREAAKSTQLNHYILVFTVVTIFYLPLSFVAALFALELFDWEKSSQKVAFSVTMVLVAGGTYCFAGFLIWVVRNPKRRFEFLRRASGKMAAKEKEADLGVPQGGDRETALPQETENHAETRKGFWEGVGISLRERRKGIPSGSADIEMEPL